MIQQRLRLGHESGAFHVLKTAVEAVNDGVELLSEYESGTLNLPAGTMVARWPVTVVLPAGCDEGHVWIGSGRIDIEIPSLRGLGLGSLFMYMLIVCIQKFPNLSVVPIDLSADDARTVVERDRRNRFYEKFGFTFEYRDEGTWGTSKPMMSHDLLTPELQLGSGWSAEHLP